jgi:hypothetical protein
MSLRNFQARYVYPTYNFFQEAQTLRLNKTRAQKVRGQFLTLPLGDNFYPGGGELSPRGEFCPLRLKLSPGGDILCLPLHSSK